MKSHKAELNRIEYLLEDIHKLEDLIALHRSANNQFMESQYEAKKLDQFKKLLVLLAESKLNTSEPQTFNLIHRLIQRFYPQAEQFAKNSSLVQPITLLIEKSIGQRKQVSS